MNTVCGISMFFVFFLFASTAQAATIGRPINYVGLTNGLVGHWTFDAADMSPNVRDRSGQGNHGNLSGQSATTSVGGRLGQGLSFDGVDDKVSFTSTNYGTTHSISFWINYQDTSDGVVIGGVNSNYGAYVSSPGSAGLLYYSANSNNVNVGHGGLVKGQWYYLTVVRVGTSVSFYKNGSQIGATQTLASNDNLSLSTLGSYSINTFFTGMLLDDVRIYNRALSASEIKQLYAMGATKLGLSASPAGSLSSGLVGHWTFDGVDMYPNVRDKSGQGNHGYLVGQTATTSVGGRMGQAFYFSIDNAHVRTQSTIAGPGTGEVSLVAWVKISSAQSYATIVHVGDTTFNHNSQYFGIDRLASGQFVFSVNAAGGGSRLTHNASFGSTSAYIIDSRWHLLVGVREGDNLKAYVDGNLVDTYALSAGYNIGTTANVLGIGDSQSLGALATGSIDDVRIYNRALSASEIKQLYAMGATKLGLSTPTASSLSSGLVGHWTFDGKDMSPNVRDISGQGNHGDLIGQTATTSVGGRLGQALSFDGVDDMVQISPSLDLMNQPRFTVSVWFTRTKDFGDIQWLWGSVSGPDFSYVTYGNGLFSIEYFQDVVMDSILIMGIPYTIPPDRWTHAVFVKDNQTGYLYVDGVLLASDVGSDTTTVSGSQLFVGGDNGGNSSNKGSLDDVRVYNRALSASEVQQLYNMGR